MQMMPQSKQPHFAYKYQLSSPHTDLGTIQMGLEGDDIL